ncbi:glycosyltransferase [Chthonobacter rhizosphaerae]|uniref:O-linked N-acetylglucosamine transferase, SPINDLY family protein n=1 Tax=Chthonobacter rhizosphaerae TaxID=2735553 RepID=UPI0015EFB9F5|nr:glycosyltransferase [Chthonobacter rhizosphaerae]
MTLADRPADSWIEQTLQLIGQGALGDAGSLALSRLAQARTADGLHALALVRLEQGDPRAALTLLRTVELIAPSPRLHHNMAIALGRLGQTMDAITLEQRVIEAAPDYVPSYKALAGLLQREGDLAAAADVMGVLCGRAVEAHAPAVLRDAVATLREIGHPPRTWSRLANMLRIGGHEDEANVLLDLRLAQHPRDLGALLIRAMATLRVVHMSEAEVRDRRARYADALSTLEAAVAEASAEELASAAGEVGMAKPFFLSYQGEDDTDLQRRYGRVVSAMMAARFPDPLPPPPTDRPRIRVGFVTAYMTLHSVSKLFRGWIRDLDRSKFEVFGYQLSPDADPTRDEIAGWCERFVSGDHDGETWRRILAEDAPDVLIYPEIGMHPLAVQLAAQRLAPVQAMAWGHPVTSGLETVDYFLSSALMEPETGDQHYVERLVRLPGLSIAYAPLPVGDATMARDRLGLREDAVVYVCCQSLFKYLPRHDEVFLAIAVARPDAQFLFIGDGGHPATAVFRTRLERAFGKAGLDFARHVAITPPVAPDAFPALLKAGDIYLDSIGWSGGNTTLEAVACDLPVVTLPTVLMRGRHSAAILTQMGLGDTIATGIVDYITRAVRLADPERRAALVERQRAGRPKLYGDMRPVQALERLLVRAVAERRPPPPVADADEELWATG